MYQKEYKFSPEEILDYLRKSQSDDPLLTVEEVCFLYMLVANRCFDIPITAFPSRKKSSGAEGDIGNISSLKYINSSAKPSIRCRNISIVVLLNVGRYSAGIISLWSTTFRTERSTHPGTCDSWDTTR